MTFDIDTLVAVRRRLDAEALPMVMGEGAVSHALVARIGRVMAWCGPQLWAVTTDAVVADRVPRGRPRFARHGVAAQTGE